MTIFKTIRMRMLIVPAGAIFAVLVTALIGLYGLNDSRSALNEASKSTSAVLYVKQADMMHDALRGDVLAALLAGQGGSEINREALVADLATHAENLETQIANLLALDLPPEVQATVNSVTAPLEAYVSQARAIVPLALTNVEQGRAQYPEFMVSFSDLENRMAAAGEAIEAFGTAASDEKASHAGIFILALAIWWTLSTATFLAINWIISRGITGSISRVSGAMKDVGDGKLDVTIADISDKGEIGEIARSLDGLRKKLTVAEEMSNERLLRQAELQKVTEALSVGLKDLAAGNFTRPISTRFETEYEVLRNDFNLAVDKLNHAISKVASSAESIRARSAEVTRATDDLAHRTETQAATLEQTAAAMDQMTSSVKSSANSTKEVEAIVSQARKEAEDSGSVVKSAVAAMVEIEKSSSHISQIIGVIDDIAFQTNLLALNAGVEAARAGDAGRGFAVVASEVGALAQRSSVAAKEIKNLISASTQHVGIGVDQVGQAGSALNSIVERVAQISNLVSNIASGASEQSTGLGEINVGVNQLDVATQQNAAMVEQTTAASQLLSQNAAELSELMALFVVEGGIQLEPGGLVDVGRPAEQVITGSRQRASARPPRDAFAGAANGAAVWTDF